MRAEETEISAAYMGLVAREGSDVLKLTLCVENTFYPEFVERHVTATVSSTVRRGDAVALLEATDPDLTETCHGSNDCPCARLAFAIESGKTHGRSV